jgi:Na+-driven multidrug efflux pump
MWISLFSIVMAISIGLAVGAIILESQGARKPRKARVSVVR